MTPPATRTVLLERAAGRLTERLLELDRALEKGDQTAWLEYVTLAEALAVVEPATRPERTGRLLTTGEMARRLGVSTKTLLRHRKRGELTPAVELARRGPAALRWRGTEAG